MNRIAQQEYCDDVINFKIYSKSFKDKARIPNFEENWAIFKNVHKPIIDREIFESVQKLTKKTKCQAPKADNASKNMYCDLLYCADCGSKLWSHVNTINKDIQYFSCSNYKVDTRGACETRHYIRADAIEHISGKITVYETEGVGKSRSQRIRIHYKFIGYIEIPECEVIIKQTREKE